MKRMSMNRSLVRVCVVALLAAGCSEEAATGTGDPPEGADAASVDGGGDVGLDVDTPDVGGDVEGDVEGDADADPVVCEPLLECPTDACGPIDDGCEGTLECEPCACTDGVAAASSCGVCGWGEVRCDPGETGAGECSLSDLRDDDVLGQIGTIGDGFPDCDTNVVYLDLGAQTNGDGTQESPFNDFDSAFDKAKTLSSTPTLVAMTEGTVARYGEVVLEEEIGRAHV